MATVQEMPNPKRRAAVMGPDAWNGEYIPEDQAKADAGIGGVRHFLASARQAVEDVNSIRANPDRMQTQAANDARIIKLAEAVTKRLYEGHRQARVGLEASRANAEAALERARDLKPDMWAPSIVARFAGMNAGEKMSAFDAALEAGDKAVLAAILTAPAIVTGFTSEQKAALQLRFDLKYAAAELAKIDVIAHAERRLNDAADHILRVSTQFYSGTEKQADAERLYGEVIKSYELAPASYVS